MPSLSKNLEEMILKYKEEFRNNKIISIYILMDAILEGIDFFEKLSLKL